MGATRGGQSLARQAKIRLFTLDGDPTRYVLTWHAMAWDSEDGSQGDTLAGAIEGTADQVHDRLAALNAELHRHMIAALDPFGRAGSPA